MNLGTDSPSSTYVTIRVGLEILRDFCTTKSVNTDQSHNNNIEQQHSSHKNHQQHQTTSTQVIALVVVVVILKQWHFSPSKPNVSPFSHTFLGAMVWMKIISKSTKNIIGLMIDGLQLRLRCSGFCSIG
jgi:hypothetical protein